MNSNNDGGHQFHGKVKRVTTVGGDGGDVNDGGGDLRLVASLNEGQTCDRDEE